MTGCPTINQLAVLENCPDSTEQILFFNVASQVTGTALRNWSDVLACLVAGLPKVIQGSVGASGLPQDGQPVYSNSRIANLGAANGGEISFNMAGSIYYSYGSLKSFNYDPLGIITLLNGNTFSLNDPFSIDTNQ